MKDEKPTSTAVSAAREKEKNKHERDEAKELRSFLSTKKVLIVDTQSTSRVGLTRALTDMGAKPNLVTSVHSYPLARELLPNFRPQVIITDYNLGHDYGINLVQDLRAIYPDPKDTLFILVTANSSQSAVAHAAEEDVDLYILKPYTLETLRKAVLGAIREKLNPSEYVRLIEEGKRFLEKSEAPSAIQSFEQAMKHNDKPSLACFYHGKSHALTKAVEMAQNSYSKGLEFNKMHYKCLTGLYESLVSQNRSHDAYQVLKRISRYFPASSARLSSVLKLAVATGNYEDIENYYEHFLGVDRRDEELSKHVCAALIVSGRYHLRNNQIERGTKLLHKAAITAQSRTQFLSEIIHSLVDSNLPAEADQVLRRYPPETQSSTEYLALDLLISLKLVSLPITVQKGRKLIRDGRKDPLIYRVLIEASARAGLKDAAESLANQACQLWPARSAIFLKAAEISPSGASGSDRERN